MWLGPGTFHSLLKESKQQYFSQFWRDDNNNEKHVNFLIKIQKVGVENEKGGLRVGHYGFRSSNYGLVMCYCIPSNFH